MDSRYVNGNNGAEGDRQQGSSDRTIRLAVLQRVCTGYRVSLFTTLAAANRGECRLFIGDDLPNSKIRSTNDLANINVTRLKTHFLRWGRRVLPWHRGLIRQLREFAPDVILCEGESHFVGYLQAMLFRFVYARHVALLHWCYAALPGEPPHRRDIAAAVKRYWRRHFDALVLYSSYGRERLIAEGEDSDRVFVATNVGNVSQYLALSDRLELTKTESRQRLGLPDRFTVLYAGTLDQNKRAGVLLDLARQGDPSEYTYAIVGAGPLLEALRTRCREEGIRNVVLPGRVTDTMAMYYRAADVLVVPGRGGIVMSEALASSVPVIVHEADGTEFDLVVDGVTGIRLSSGDPMDFWAALERLRSHPTELAVMGHNGQHLVRHIANEQEMAKQILRACRYAMWARQKCC